MREKKAHLNICIPTVLLTEIDAYAAEHGIKRSEAARLLLRRALESPSPHSPPALPNWQVEAWTSLLRGLFGDKRLVLTAGIKALLVEGVAARDERDRQVLTWRFGLGGRKYTLKDVGAMRGIQRERARQIEAQALRRLRGWLRNRGIWELLKEQLEKKESNE